MQLQTIHESAMVSCSVLKIGTIFLVRKFRSGKMSNVNLTGNSSRYHVVEKGQT